MASVKTVLIVEDLFSSKALIESREWQTLADGVFVSEIYDMENAGPRSAFLHYLPGASVPNHLHTGLEHILILHGSQTDGTRTYRAGTLVIHPPGTQHHLVSEEGCLALGVWEKPVSFTASAKHV